MMNERLYAATAKMPKRSSEKTAGRLFRLGDRNPEPHSDQRHLVAEALRATPERLSDPRTGPAMGDPTSLREIRFVDLGGTPARSRIGWTK